jgi:hypothetical protein
MPRSLRYAGLMICIKRKFFIPAAITVGCLKYGWAYLTREYRHSIQAWAQVYVKNKSARGDTLRVPNTLVPVTWELADQTSLYPNGLR